MSWFDAVFYQLLLLSAICCATLLVGCGLTSCWSQPAERVRSIQVTFIAALLACSLQQWTALPKWRVALLPARSEAPVDRGPHREELALAFNATSSHSAHHSVAQEQLDIPLSPRADESPEATRPQFPVAARRVERARADSFAMPASQSANSVTAWPMIRGILVGIAALGAVLNGVFLAIGVLRLAILLRASRPAARRTCELFHKLVGYQPNIELRASSQISVPLTSGVWRPVIVVPAAIEERADDATLRYCLLHEWAHVQRRDTATWWLLQALQPLLWFQPLYWRLRRELRICQDQLADHFASEHSDPIEYAELLLSMAHERQAPGLALALSMQDEQSSLARRIHVLLAGTRLAVRCRARMLIVAGCCMAVAALMLASVQISRAEPQAEDAAPTQQNESQAEKPADDTESDEPKPATDESSPSKPESEITKAVSEERSDGSLFFAGVVMDKSTNLPIQGAQVVVRRSTWVGPDRNILEESQHKTNMLGIYTFVIPPEQVKEPSLYIELDVEHEDYAWKKNFGYALSMIRKNLRLGEPPFFSLIRLDPAESLTGRVLGSDGKPMAGAHIIAYSKPPEKEGEFEYGSFFRTATADDGRFRLNLVKDGPAVFWVVPEDAAPRQIVVGSKRGDWGDIEMPSGVRVEGQVLDALGNPVPGVWVNVVDQDSQRELQMPVATSMVRSAQTDDQGRFELCPLSPGSFELAIDESPREARLFDNGRKSVPVPAVFPRQTVSITETPQPMTVRAIPHVQFEGQYVDSQGQPCKGHDVTIWGELDGSFYYRRLEPDAAGKISGIIPHGLENAKLQTITNEHSSLRVRMGKDKPLDIGREFAIGTIEADITDVEIVRYKAPIALIRVVNEQDQPIVDFQVAGVYEDGPELLYPVGGKPTNFFFEKQIDGRARSSQMLPDQKTKIIVSAKGYDDAEQSVTLKEGEERELRFVLKATTDAATGGDSP